jgi:hypothetical protein
MKIAGENHLSGMRQMEKIAAQWQKTEAPANTEGVTPKWTL